MAQGDAGRGVAARVRGLALGGLGAVCAVVAAGAASADDPAAVAAARVGHFKDIGRAARAIQLEVAKPSPDAAVVAEAARKIEGLASEIPSWFPPGSGPDAVATTQARAEIWADSAGFRVKAAELGARAQALEKAAAAGGDQAGLKSGFMGLAQACQSCHSVFRSGDH